MRYSGEALGPIEVAISHWSGLDVSAYRQRDEDGEYLDGNSVALRNAIIERAIQAAQERAAQEGE